MSTDLALVACPVASTRHDAAGSPSRRLAKGASGALPAQEALSMARALTAKYGAGALPLARSRAERAADIGDDLALDAWRSVIEATQRLLWRASVERSR